jgi:hypothetical protein
VYVCMYVYTIYKQRYMKDLFNIIYFIIYELRKYGFVVELTGIEMKRN